MTDNPDFVLMRDLLATFTPTNQAGRQMIEDAQTAILDVVIRLLDEKDALRSELNSVNHRYNQRGDVIADLRDQIDDLKQTIGEG